MMNRKTTKVIVFIIVIAIVLSSFSFIFFLTPVYGAEKENVYASNRTLMDLHTGITPQEQERLSDRLRELERFLKYIHENYKDEVDFETLVNGAFQGAMNSLGDPNSVFFTEEAGQAFIEHAIGEFEGIGVVMTMNPGNVCVITEVIAGGPAARAGVLSGDIIRSIDGQDVSENSLQEISNMLRGRTGTSVQLTVQRAGANRTFAITRERVVRANIDYEMLEDNIGYIALRRFGANGAREFRAAREQLIGDGAESLVLDLRNNSGGLVNVAIDIANEFISDGYIVHMKQRGEIFESIHATSRTGRLLETVLLVNEHSASASEILAGALQDHNVATIVGTVTYGKGTAQMMAYTDERRPHTLSIYYFLTPDKNDIHNVGIMPDYVVRNSLGEHREEAARLYQAFAPFAENTRPRAGDTGINVFAAQQRLFLLGYSLEMTAVMDDATVQAIRLFQQEQGLYVYGVLDFTTMSRIREVTSAYINNDSETDLQLQKAIELLGGR